MCLWLTIEKHTFRTKPSFIFIFLLVKFEFFQKPFEKSKKSECSHL